jgi:eukaryotic-like serine/threonine-protein kinase
MDLERWKRVRALSEALAGRPHAEWDRYLAASGEAADLRAEALALLREDAVETSTLAAAPPLAALQALREVAGGVDHARRLGQRIGPWQLVSVLGEGGMGSVYLAERVEGGFTQRAALKRVRPGLQAEELLARFRYERQILAGLGHPNIARLIDGGAGPDGEPYLALEYVEGQPLREHCDALRLDLSARLRLFLTVCEAVAYAHDRLVVHRDLKPSNILVDASGQVKLLDFGIAKLLDAERTGEATALGQRAFTPEYAAPEQILGAPTSMAMDVYALGVLLFELLTGQRPYRVASASAAAVEQAVLNTEPSRPSSVVTRRLASGDTVPEQVAQARATQPEQLRRQLRGDLDAIVLKALRRDPAQRYASVRLLAEDLRAYLERRPVAARRGDRRYRALRFVQRHALAVALGTVAVLSLLVGLGLSLWQAEQARSQRDLARAEALKSATALEFMRELFDLADPEGARGRVVTARELLDRGAERIGSELRDQPAVRGDLLRAMGEAYLGLGLPAEAMPLLQEALALAEGDDASDLLPAAAEAMGRALHEAGEREQALARMLPVRDALVVQDAATARSAAGLDFRIAYTLHTLGRHAEAEPRYLAALAEFESQLGLAHRRSQAVAQALVGLYELLRRREDSLALAERALAAVQDAGASDPVKASALSGLAMVMTNRGELDRAEALRRDALAAFESAFGARHPTTLRALGNLGNVQFNMRRYAEARDTFAQALEGLVAHFGEEHPQVAPTALNLAFALLLNDEAEAARAPAEHALRVRLAAYGPEHIDTARARAGLGSVLLDLGHAAEAEAETAAAIAVTEARFGPDSFYLLSYLGALARAHIALGRDDCSASERGRAIAAAQTPPDTRRGQHFEVLLAACRLRRGDAGADDAMRAALAAYRHLPDADPYALRRLGELERDLLGPDAPPR